MGRARGFNLRYEIVDSCAKRRRGEGYAPNFPLQATCDRVNQVCRETGAVSPQTPKPDYFLNTTLQTARGMPTRTCNKLGERVVYPALYRVRSEK